MPEVASGPLTWVIVAPQYQAALEQNPRAGYLEYVARNVGKGKASELATYVVRKGRPIFVVAD